MNIGILTAGGVCPGANTLIRSITLREKNQGNHVHGFSDGFRGINQNVKSYFDQQHIEEGPGTLLKTSYDFVDIDKAAKNLRTFDRLYCICGNESMKSARDLALDDRVDTNIIGIAKTIFNDIPGLESVGFQTAVQELARYIDCAFIEATSTNSIVFLEVPGRRNDKLATYAGLARNSKVTNIVTPSTRGDPLSSIEYSYANRGYAVVIISEMCDYHPLVTSLSVRPKIITPGYLIRDVEPCVYDSILAERMAKEAFKYAQDHRDFIKGATNVMPFKDYLRIM
jgi:6-phosphofructokinase 1